jgi:hypothetical protein
MATNFQIYLNLVALSAKPSKGALISVPPF